MKCSVWVALLVAAVLGHLCLAEAAGVHFQAADAERLRSATMSSRLVQEIVPGVRHLHWHIVPSEAQPGPWNINILDVDLTRAGVEVRVVEAHGGLETTSRICQRVGALAAVNGGYFDASGPLGLVVVEGEIRSGTVAWKPPRAVLGLYEDKAWLDVLDQRGSRLIPQNPTDWFEWSRVRFALGAGPRLIFKGRVEVNAAPEGFDADSGIVHDQPAARTVVGLGRNRMFLLTVDGDQPDLSIGMQMAQAAGVLWRECGALYAMALDGGSSTTMVIDGRVINFPSNRDEQGRAGVERPVANTLCVFAREEAP